MAEKALAVVIDEACVHGVSTRSVGELVQAVGMSGNSGSQISRLCAELPSSIAVAVTLAHVTRVVRDADANHLLPVEDIGSAAVIYFGLTLKLVGGFRLLERRHPRHLHIKHATTAPDISRAA